MEVLGSHLTPCQTWLQNRDNWNMIWSVDLVMSFPDPLQDRCPCVWHLCDRVTIVTCFGLVVKTGSCLPMPGYAGLTLFLGFTIMGNICGATRTYV